jgi:integrase
MRRYGLSRNPASADLVDRPTVRYSGEFRTLDTEQLAALIRAAASTQDAALYLTAAQTGLRQGELRALRWADVDFAADRIHVRRSATVGANATIKTPKSGRVRSVPMVPQIATALARLGQREQFAGPDDLVFPIRSARSRTTRCCAGATTGRSRMPVSPASAFTICAMRSVRPRSRRSRCLTCRPCSATPTSPRRCATSTTAPARTTRSVSRRRSGAILCPRLCPQLGTQSETQKN